MLPRRDADRTLALNGLAERSFPLSKVRVFPIAVRDKLSLMSGLLRVSR